MKTIQEKIERMDLTMARRPKGNYNNKNNKNNKPQPDKQYSYEKKQSAAGIVSRSHFSF